MNLDQRIDEILTQYYFATAVQSSIPGRDTVRKESRKKIKELFKQKLATVRPEEKPEPKSYSNGVVSNEVSLGWNMALAKYDENCRGVLGE